MTAIIILGAICLLIGLYLTFESEDELNNLFGCIMVPISIICFIIAPAIDICNNINQQPTALDVYRGRTTLEITYKDSVAIDSVVVFKKK